MTLVLHGLWIMNILNNLIKRGIEVEIDRDILRFYPSHLITKKDMFLIDINRPALRNQIHDLTISSMIIANTIINNYVSKQYG